MHDLTPSIDILLDSASDNGRLTDACSIIYQRLKSATPEASLASTLIDREVRLPAGIALSPGLAATCLLDEQRTAKFLRGTAAAINALARRFHGQTIEVVYAGTGPFAPLALLLVPSLGSLPVRFTLIDINQQSCDSVRSLFEHFDLMALVSRIICTDATTYRHPSPIHLAVSETMQRSLAREPFVEIMRNLRTQLATGGALVPESVTIDLAVIDAEQEQSRWRGEKVRTHPRTIARLLEITSAPEQASSAGTLVSPGSFDQRSEWLALFTRIAVYGEHILEPYESGLTTPQVLWELSSATGRPLNFRYETGAEPGMRWTSSS